MSVKREIHQLGPGLISVGEIDLGATCDFVTFYQENTFFEKTADQVRGILDKVLVDRKCGVRTSLSAVAAAKLSTDSEGKLQRLVVTAPAQDGEIRTIILDKVRLKSRKDMGSHVRVDFEAFLDPDKGRFGIIGN